MPLLLRKLQSLLDQRWFQRAGLVGWLVAWVVVAVLLLSPVDVPHPAGSDKLAHLLIFAVLAFATVVFCRQPRALAGLAILTVAISYVLELLQLVLPTRSYDTLDLVANGGGAALGFIAALLALRVLERSAPRPAEASPSRA